jgi:hypothetical protein
MSEFDDLPLDPSRDGAAPAYYPEPLRTSWAPLALIGLAVIMLGGLGWLVWQQRRVAGPVTPAASVAAPAPETVAAPPVALPPLDQMDGFLRSLFAGLSSQPTLLAWLATDDLVGSIATAIDRLANGRTPARDLAPLRPGAGFTVVTRRGVPYVDPSSYARYNGIVEAVATVDPARLATIYTTIEPRLAEAYARQGHTGSLREALQRAIATVLATPDPPAEVALVGGVGGYSYADPQLEALPSAQKHLLRMGPANVQRVKEAVRQFAAALPPAASTSR